MSGDLRELLTAVSEQEDDLPQLQSEASSPTPAPLASTPPNAGSPHILRRLRTHFTGRRASARTQASSSNPAANFNPEAPDFVPRMPPKRKASSMGRSGKSTSSASRNNQSSDQPIIRSEEVFARGASRAISDCFDVYSGDGATDDDDHSQIFDIVANQVMNRDEARMTEALSLMRNRVTKIQRQPELLASNSVILFSYDGEGSTAEESDDSAGLRYLPLCPATTSGKGPISKDTPLTILPRHRERIDTAIRAPLSTKATWPPNKLPVELFDLIAGYLSRDAVKSMRLVSKEFEEKVSCNLFHTSVVPFNTELYDMIDGDTRAAGRASQSHRPKGKGKAGPWDISGPGPSGDLTLGTLHWQNKKNDTEGKVYKGHGLRVFQGFGPHIRRFGMSFDVLEGQLSRPPIKRELDHVDSYHGSYDWPLERYTRFANLAGLEKTADETLRMKSAFSHLTNVHDLALSVDSGLGWLNGPDKSIYARVFQRLSPIFGRARTVPDRQTEDANEFWATIRSCNSGLGPNMNPKETSLVRRSLSKHPGELSGLRGTHYGDRSLWSSIAANRAAPTIAATVAEDLQYGIMYTTPAIPDATAQSLYDKSALVPSELRKEQKEWLLETEWAQRAFLECYMLAIIDNPTKFAMVKTLAIAKLSSGFLPLLARESFWDALPNLTDVTILVKPDWRTVEKDNAGFAETCPQNPSEAVRAFHRCVLRDRLCLRQRITKLNIGWASGGEHADGIFARNNHILPAPITQLEHATAASATSVLVFTYVEHLTLTNCWMTPPALEEFVKSHAEKGLKTLTLDSVSLTSHPRFPAGGAAQAQQQMAQALMGAVNAANFGQVGPNGLHNLPQVGQQNAPNVPQQNQQAQAAPAWMMGNLAQQGLNPQQQLQQQIMALHAQNQNIFGNGFGAGNALANAANNIGFGNLNNAPANNVNANANANPFGFWNGIWNAGAAAPQPPQQQAPPPAAPPVPINPPQATAQNTHAHWSSDHREGSWPEVLNKISPGPIFTDYLPQPLPWDEQHPPRTPTSLRTIEFKSCGYARLSHSTAFDQFAIEAPHGNDHHLSLWFRSRQAALSPAMLTTTDRFLGRIIQYMPFREQEALRFAWGLSMGWNDHIKAEEAEYDGQLPGGTGRFSGTVSQGMGLMSAQQV